MAVAKRDENSVTTLIGVSDIDDSTPVNARVGAANKALHVELVAGTITGANGAILDGVDSDIKATVLDYANSNPLAVRLTNTDGDYVAAGAGTQYTEADTDASITGTAIMWEDAADTLVAVSATKPLPIEITDVSVAVTGTFWQATQPVSGTFWQATQPVSGTFWQATQPVSIAAAVTVQATNLDIRDLTSADVVTVTGGAGQTADVKVTLDSEAVAVTGTFWQATQPVSGTVAVTNADLTTIAGDTTSIQTAVEIMDDWDDSNYCNVNLNVAGTDVAANAGVLNAQTLRVTIATDDEVNNFLGTIDADTSTLAGAVSGSEMQVDVVAALPAGTNAIGKLVANNGVDIGDVDVASIVPGTGATNLGKAEDAAHSSGDVGVMVLAIRDDDPVAAVSGTAGDYTPLHLDSRGVLWTRNIPDTTDLANLGGEHVKKYYTNAGAVTDGIIWSPAAGKRWFVTDIFINVSAAATVTLEDDLAAGDSAVWKAELAANSGWSHSFNTPLYSGEDAADLIITTSAANVYVTVTGYEI